MKLKYIFIASISALSSAHAAMVAITNHDFEDLTLADGSFSSSAITGWAASGSGTSGVVNPNEGYYTDPNIIDTAGTSGVIGTMAGDSTAFIFDSNGVTLTNTTTETVAENVVYTLTVAVGNRDVGSNTYGGYLIELLDGDSVLNSEMSTTPVAVGSFGDVTVSYTGQAGDSGNLRIRLSLASTTGTNPQADFDNVRLDASPVPEPSSTALLGLGGLALILRRRK